MKRGLTMAFMEVVSLPLSGGSCDGHNHDRSGVEDLFQIFDILGFENVVLELFRRHQII